MVSDERLRAGYRIGDFEITGDFGSGYRARDHDLGRDVAVEPLPVHASVRGFQKRARALTGFDHPNIVAVLDLVIDDGRPYLIVDLLEGETLAERLSHRALSRDETVAIAAQLVAAIQAAHDLGIVHGDLHAANVVLSENDTAQVRGFGLATGAGPADDVRAVERILAEMSGAEAGRLPDALEQVLGDYRHRAEGPTRQPWPFTRVARWVYLLLAVVLVITAYVTLRNDLPP